jgi:hypothetical protein
MHNSPHFGLVANEISPFVSESFKVVEFDLYY